MSTPLKFHGQESVAEIRAMAYNMIIHDTFRNSKFRDKRRKLSTFGRVVVKGRTMGGEA